MQESERQQLIEALDMLRQAEENLPSEPDHEVESVGGYFYNEWGPGYARWVKMRSALSNARLRLEETLGLGTGRHERV